MFSFFIFLPFRKNINSAGVTKKNVLYLNKNSREIEATHHIKQMHESKSLTDFVTLISHVMLLLSFVRLFNTEMIYNKE